MPLTFLLLRSEPYTFFFKEAHNSQLQNEYSSYRFVVLKTTAKKKDGKSIFPIKNKIFSNFEEALRAENTQYLEIKAMSLLISLLLKSPRKIKASIPLVSFTQALEVGKVLVFFMQFQK